MSFDRSESRGSARGVGLPITVWAGLLCGGAVLLGIGVAALVLAFEGNMSAGAAIALGVGATAGLVVVVVAVIAASRVASALRGLHADAVDRLRAPSAPLARTGRRRVVAWASSELGELARALDALHLRVRVADDLGEQHRRQAETAGAGVFELLSGLVAAEEGARGQLAAELHDTVAQSLMMARGVLSGGTPTAEELERLADLVEDAEEQVRAVMARTRPPALRDGDLASAVALLRDDMLARYGLTVHVDWPPSPYPLPLASAVTLYRFFQEALLNVVKHADVDDAFVCLRVEEDNVVAEVRDEGPGFDPAAVRPTAGRHVGLGLLRERARLSGGAVEVESAVGRGTTLRLQMPRRIGGDGPAAPATTDGAASSAVAAAPGSAGVGTTVSSPSTIRLPAISPSSVLSG